MTLAIPRDQFGFLPLDEEAAPNTTYTIAGASGFRDDRWFHIHFVIRFQKALNIFPILPVAFEVGVKYDTAGWQARTYVDGPIHNVVDTDEGRRGFARIFFDELKPFLSQRLRDQEAEEGAAKKQIDFRLPAIES